MQKILDQAYEYAKDYRTQGQVVDYIPALKDANPLDLAGSIIDKDGQVYEVGDVETRYTMMSIVKVVLYIMAMENYKFEDLRTYIGLKPSSKAFNSLLDLQLEDNKPVNPYVNAGALTTSYLLYKVYGDQAVEEVLKYVQKLAGDSSIYIDKNVVETSRNTGYANKAMIYSLQNQGPIDKDVNVYDILEIYNSACSITVSTRNLAQISFVLSSGGKDLQGQVLMDPNHARISRSLMALCGTYDYSGDFAVEIGIPAKSGVGGGILASTNKEIGLASYSPALDPRGNSVAGFKMLEYIAKELDLSIY